MTNPARLAEIATLIGDPTRAAMLTSLMDGRALTASELATASGVTPQTASGHLARLTQAGLLAMARQGRHRYHRLAGQNVAQMLEVIMALTPTTPPRVGPRDQAMRRARTCYDHLAGELAVAIADRLTERGHIELTEDGGAVTPGGTDFLAGLGLDLTTKPGRMFCRPCLDWSERRPHIAGTVGAALCTHCLRQGWVRRIDGTRALTVTPAGQLALRQAFGV